MLSGSSFIVRSQIYGYNRFGIRKTSDGSRNRYSIKVTRPCVWNKTCFINYSSLFTHVDNQLMVVSYCFSQKRHSTDARLAMGSFAIVEALSVVRMFVSRTLLGKSERTTLLGVFRPPKKRIKVTQAFSSVILIPPPFHSWFYLDSDCPSTTTNANVYLAFYVNLFPWPSFDFIYPTINTQKSSINPYDYTRIKKSIIIINRECKAVFKRNCVH